MGSRYPKKTELLNMLSEAGNRLRQALLSTSELDLAQRLPTVGHALLHVVAAHTAFHAGQLAVWRRARRGTRGGIRLAWLWGAAPLPQL